ncbi:MAG: protein kinase domain-containing protein [Myxococcota bacterium]
MGTVDEADRGQGPGKTKPLLSIAAESIVARTGVAETVVDVVHGRALEHYGKGLRQYLAVQLGAVDRAGRAFAELRAAVAATGAPQLAEPPGLRANLYREARRIAVRRLTESGAPTAGASLPWRAPSPEAGVSPGTLHRLRSELPAADAELLELRYARELSPAEIAAVIEAPVEAVESRLAAAERRARTAVPAPLSPAQLRRALLEAFALEGEIDGEPGAGPAAERVPLPAGTVIGGRYAIERRVGSGAFGDVYRANDTEVPGHVLALKLLHQPSCDEAARTRALRELHLIASVFHPSVVQFKGHGWYENRLWFVMPWYEGETLEARIGRAPLSRAEARHIFEPLARALATMHAAGIRHQDVKPDNIFLARIRGFGHEGDDEVLPVLIDLGVAAKEAEMVVAGTPDYFAPEVAAQFASVEARAPIGFPADVFSLALSLRNALDPDIRQDVPAGAVETFIEQRARSAPGASGRRGLKFLEPSFRQWLSMDPAERPTADEFADQLAVLTRPEERRRRIGAVLRWVLPLGVAIATVFGSVVYALNERAERESLEAARAKIVASGLKEDLEMSLEQRRALEADVEQIRDRYSEGQLTRRELAQELARTEGRLGVVRSRLAATEREREGLEENLGQSQDRLEEAQSELAVANMDLEQTRRQLDETRAELTDFEDRARATEEELAEARASLEEARREASEATERAAESERRVATLRSEAASERSRAKQLERQLDQARSARDRARTQVSRLEGEVARLEGPGGRGKQGGGGSSEDGSDASDPDPDSESDDEPSSP